MKPFGFLLLIVVIKELFSKNTKNAKYLKIVSILVFLELFVNAGYFLKVGSYEILYSEFVLIILILFSMSFIIKHSLNKRLVYAGFILMSSIILTEVLLVINPLSEPILRNNDYIVPQFSIYSLLISIRVLFFIIIALTSKSAFKEEGYKTVTNTIQVNGMAMISLLYVEWIINNIFKNDYFRRIVSYIFGTGVNTVDVLLTRGNLHSIQGFMREPAHLSEGLFYFLLIIIMSDIEIRKVNKLFLMTVPLILLSGSFSGVLYIIALFVIYLSKNKITSVYTLAIITVVLISIPFIIRSDLFKYYYSRLLNSLDIFRDGQTSLALTSEGFRLNTIIYTTKAFFKRPFIGLGLGVPYSYGFLSVLFASIGSIGAYLWYTFVFKIYGGIKFRVESMFIIIALLIVWSFTGNISITYSVFVLIIALLVGANDKNRLNAKEYLEYRGE